MALGIVAIIIHTAIYLVEVIDLKEDVGPGEYKYND